MVFNGSEPEDEEIENRDLLKDSSTYQGHQQIPARQETSPRPGWRRKCTLNLCWMVRGIVIGAVVTHTLFYSKPTRVSTSAYKEPVEHYSSHPSTITYGHVHVAKTAGTSMNGELSLKYERICGHKGYSFDAISHNQRVREIQRKTGQNGTGINNIKDSLAKSYPKYSWSCSPPEVMFERGVEDCDWVSFEMPWQVWPGHVEQVVDHLELHVPCRDPIDHLLSMCNMKHRKIHCDSGENPKRTKAEIDICLMFMDRFNMKLTKIDSFDLKCFEAINVKQYMEYLDKKLQKRRVTEKYIFRASNSPRDKERECLHNATTVFREQVRDYLLNKYDYFQFCNICMGSENDLFRGQQ